MSMENVLDRELDRGPGNSNAVRPPLSFWQIWNMGFGFLGIQFGFALQNANTSRIFETLGADPSNLALYWLAAPITGLIVQPIIGYYSDRTWHPKWGRRRPYFAIGAILASLSLLIMPNSPTLWIAVGVLWIMDASINVSMEPFRAFVGDKLPSSQRTRGFAFQSFFIGTGAIVASFLPWIFSNWFDISNTAEEGIIPEAVRYSFYIGAAVLMVSVFWTVFSSSEYPPDDLDAQRRRHQQKRKIQNEEYFRSRFRHISITLAAVGLAIAAAVYILRLEGEIHILGLGLIIFGLAFFISSVSISQGRSHTAIVHITHDFYTMPRTMVQLAWVQFFSWFALFSMWIYTTPAVTSHIFHATDTTSEAYNDGADLVGTLFGGYNGIAALAAFLLPVLAKHTSRRMTHLVALFCGGTGLISIYFITNPSMLWLSMAGVGIAWASILSVPYAMLAGSLPSDKMGYYMGIFNFFIVIPQIVAGTILGFMLNHFFNGQSIYVLVAGGISMIIAGALNLTVDDRDDPARS
jgi:maltose/moltooligosaccharide transporter